MDVIGGFVVHFFGGESYSEHSFNRRKLPSSTRITSNEVSDELADFQIIEGFRHFVKNFHFLKI